MVQLLIMEYDTPATEFYDSIQFLTQQSFPTRRNGAKAVQQQNDFGFLHSGVSCRHGRRNLGKAPASASPAVELICW
jgi:hypothetical protein